MGCSSCQSKLQQIYIGWKRLAIKDSEIEPIAQERAAICAKCDFNNKNWCVRCGCFVPAKVRSSTNCPLNYWA